MERSEQRTSVVCDAGPLIHLHELDSMALLQDFSAVLVPIQVWDEVAQHRPQALELAGPWVQKVEVVVSTQPSFLALVQTLALDLGEQAALSLMKQRPDAIFLTDVQCSDRSEYAGTEGSWHYRYLAPGDSSRPATTRRNCGTS